MNLRRRLVGVSALSCAALVTFVVSTAFQWRNESRSQVVQERAMAMIVEALDLAELTHEVSSLATPRARREWAESVIRIERAMTSVRDAAPGLAAECDDVEAKTVALIGMVEVWGEARVSHRPEGGLVVPPQVQRQVDGRARDVVTATLALVQEADLRHVRAGERRRTVEILGLLALVLASGWVAFDLSRLLLRRVEILQRAIGRVASGDLEARVDMPGTGEFAELARSFEAMTADLSGLTASRDELLAVAQERDTGLLELERRNRDLSQFVYVASHDLRSPLVNVLGFTEELAMSVGQLETSIADLPPGEPTRDRMARSIAEIGESLHFVRASAGHMDRLLHGLLRLSRAGRAATSPTDVDIASVVAGIVKQHELAVRAGEVSFHCPELPRARADVALVTQVFSNLVGNALKHRDPSRPVRIAVEGSVREPDVVYCVRDDGPGIAPAHQGQVFLPFHRLNPHATEGDGLGLAIVRTCVERMGGRIWVESEPGEGAAFFVALPRTNPEEGP